MIVRHAPLVCFVALLANQVLASLEGVDSRGLTLEARHGGHDDDMPMDMSMQDQEHEHAGEEHEGEAGAEAEASSPSSAGHSHGPSHSHGKPSEHFDPSSIPPDPLSYLVHDSSEEGHGTLMSAHITLMTVSWIGFLPLTLFLRTAKHPLFHVAQLSFVVTTLLGLLASLLYKAQTQDLYPNNKHAPIGWFSIILAGALVTVDTGKVLAGIARWWKSGDSIARLPAYALTATLSSNDASRGDSYMTASPSSNSYELVGTSEERDAEAGRLPTLAEQDESIDASAPSSYPPQSRANHRGGHRYENSLDYVNAQHHVPAASAAQRAASPPGHGISPPLPSTPIRSSSRDSTDTLHENERQVRWTTADHASSPIGGKLPAWLKAHGPPSSRMSTFLKYFHIFLLRSLLCFGYANVLLGLIVYTGKCRGEYINACLAHVIKGSIFVIWGILSFARYLGAWSELGWSWNAKPKADNWRKHAPSPEFIESFLIFFYGATNTWMERFSAKPGDPFTIHQIQHISIALLYFGAGSLALLLESKTVRGWLAQGVRANQAVMVDDHRTADPPSYSTSFNPMPAFVAALTGIAMGAHHQDYVYAVKIHQLWGAMLVAFAVCRVATYAFLWLRPPASTLPSRPPTEVLASFFCACGGFTFMLSTEQVSYAAMANGWDDVFMMNNLCFAFIGLLMSWQAILTAVKGWATMRMAGH